VAGGGFGGKHFGGLMDVEPRGTMSTPLTKTDVTMEGKVTARRNPSPPNNLSSFSHQPPQTATKKMVMVMAHHGGGCQ